MRCIDTNVIIRLIMRDEPHQSAAAAALLQDGVVLTSGVWMEAEWVLRSVYRLERQKIADAFAALLITEGLETTDRDAIWWAINRFRCGADWADMIHLIDSAEVGSFASFDRDLERLAGPEAPARIETLK